jgi:hypothetical protein
MKCSRCQHENEAGAKFCEECAAPLARTCAKCGRPLSATAKFCPECAHPTEVATAPPDLETTRRGSVETRPSSSLVLFDKDGKVIWSAP